MTIASSKQMLKASIEIDTLRYCPRCGHALYPDMTAEKRFGVEIAICPPERIRFTYIVATETLHVVKL